MSRHAMVLDALQKGYEAEQSFAADLSPTEREAVGTFEAWAPRDLLAHNTAWSERLVRCIRGEETAWAPDEDAENAVIFAAHRGEALSAVVAHAQAVHDDLMAVVRSLQESDLEEAEKHLWTDGRPVWQKVADTACLHPLEHLGAYYIALGNGARGIAFYETAMELLRDLDTDPTWQGGFAYNLACLNALAGHREPALAGLAEALRLRPDLKDWSQKDPDLVSLHDDPAYKALYA